MHNILTLIGLCKRAGMLEAGEEPVEGAARAKNARVLLLAADAADNTARRVKHFAEMGSCLWLRVPFTKAEMGQILGRTSCAIVAVTDIGFACNIVGKLAQVDPVRYDEAHALLQIKAKRAAERKAEMLAHKKNLRTGKVKRKEPEAEPPKKETASAPQRKSTQDRPRQDRPQQDRPRSRKSADGYDSRKSGDRPGFRKSGSRPSKSNRPAPRAENRFANSRPVKKGKGSFRKSD